MNDVRLLTEPGNFAVVQLPGRKFPGVVFQGDSLHTLVSDLEAVQTSLADGTSERVALDEILELLERVLDGYVAACGKNGIALPFSR